jgi:hypothetical protein
VSAGFQYLAEEHRYLYDGRDLPSITRVLGAGGLVSYDGVPAHRVVRARDRGAAAHLAIRFVNEGRLDLSSLAPELEPYVFAWESFCSVHHADFIPELVETPLADPLLGFAGTPDVVGAFRGNMSVIEIKCTAAVHAGHHVQTAAQKLLLGGNRRPVVARYVLQLKPNGDFRLHEGTDPHDAHVFRSALHLYQWKQREGLLFPALVSQHW